MSEKNTRSLIWLITSMTVFGTVGIFSKYIPLPSGVIAFARAFIGTLFLAVFLLVRKRKPDCEKIKKNLKYLIPSGIALGANWILFFLACKTTTVPTATLSYYLAPTILVILSVFIFKEKLSSKQIISVSVALFGMVLASGVIGDAEGVSIIGIICGICAALLYAVVVIFNKLMRDIDPVDKTLVQFVISSVALLPYILLAENAIALELEVSYIVYALIIGIIHTGAAYVLYFGSVAKLKSSTVAIYSYIDPIISILVSTVFFEEPISLLAIVGAALILGASFFSEVDVKTLFQKAKSLKNDNNSSQN
ncbi:MAG: EamA family transporter [Clostridia bacterium]|nr:EamA family transporter [Clostridia bacterium]